MNSRLLAALALVALVATGCFRSETRIVVNDDGSGVVTGLMAVEVDSAIEMMSGFAEEGAEVSAQEACEGFRSDQDVPDGATTTPYDEDGYCGVRFERAFSADELEEVVADTSSGDEEVIVRRDGDGWYFEADFGEASDDLAMGGFLLDGAELSFAIRLPGRQVDHNATSIEPDGTLVWEIDVSDFPDRIYARTEPGEAITGSGGGGGGTSWGLILGIVAVIGAVVAAVVLYSHRSSDGDAAPLAAPPSSTPPQAPPAAPPTPDQPGT